MADVQKKAAPAAEGAAKTPSKTVMKKKSASTVDSEEKQPLSTKDGASPPKMKKIVKRSSGDNVKKAADGATPKKVVKKPSSVAGESEASSTKAKKTVKKASDSEATPKAKKPVDKEPVEKGIDTPKKKATDGAKKATDSAKKAAPSTPKKAPAPAEDASQADNEDQNDEDVFEDSVEESGNDAAEETNAAETEANGLKRVDSGKDLADGVDGVDGEDTERAGSEQDEDEDSEDDPFKEFKEGLRSKDQQDSRPQDDSDMQELPPLSEEEMAKLTPGKDFDISKYQTKEKAEDAAEGVTDEVEGAKDDAEDKADDAVDEAEDVAKEGEDVAEEGKDKLDDVAEEAEEAGEEAGDKLDDATKEGEDKLDDAAKGGEDKLDDATKEADDKVDDATKEGEDKLDDATKEGEDKLPEDVEAPEATEDVAKEGEDALKEGEEAAGDATKEGEEKLDDATKEGEEKLDDAAKEGEEAKEGVEDELEEGEIDIHNLTLASLKGGKVNKGGNVMVDGKPLGRITEGVLKHLVGKSVDKEGNIWNDSGKKIGKAELIPEDELEELLKEPSPFEAFPDATINGEGYAIFEGERVGKLVEGDAKKLRGMKIDADGDVLSKYGETLGKVERWEPEEEPEPEAEPEVDLSALSGKRVNKAGNLVDSDGKLFGRVVAGDVKKMIGRMCDKDGIIRSESGEELGRGELIPDDEREAMSKESAPFESFPDAKVDGEGYVVFEGEKVGKVTEGDLKRLRGMTVDQDGDILDRSGNVVGKAERWEPEAEPEPEEIDTSILAGKRVNKAGNVVDSSGVIYGRVVEGDAKRLVGRMCNKKGEILSESGDVLGRAELVPEGDREGFKDGPFAELENCTVAKDGTVVTASGDIVGRLVEGDGKKLFGRAVDEDGDVVDRNGNVLGKAERWEPEPEPEKKKGPMAGRRVNKEGGVVDEDGNLIGKLTSGDLSICAGKEIDDDGDVVDGKGTTVGHCSLIGDIKEPEEKPEDKEKREKAEQDKKLAQQMSYCLTQVLDKIKPICQMITSKIEKADATPKEDLDEEELVKEVRPLIEEGGKILQEANGIIRGLDPDGRIQANAKHRTATREATPEEYRLADILKELTGTVTKTIEDAKKKLEGMPHAKKELNPLWGLLNEPLFQILAAVGMLLSGVLGLVGRLLNGLGLGGIVDGLLGGLGIKNILGALGVGSLADSLTGKDQKGGKKKKGGLLGLGG